MRLAGLALAALMAAACSSTVPAMRITRFSAVAANQYPGFDRTVADAAAARPLYDAVRALPPAPPGRSCPIDQGLRYRLSFNEAARVVLSVVIEGSGCGEIVFSSTERRIPDEAFWSLLADTLGVTKGEIRDVKPDEVKR